MRSTKYDFSCYCGEFFPGDRCTYVGMLPIGNDVTVVAWEPFKWMNEGCIGNFSFRMGLVPVFSKEFSEIRFWWASPTQLKKITDMTEIPAITKGDQRHEG
jgi:hypothetical protein